MWCAAENHNFNIRVTYVQKDFYIRTLIKQLLTKYQIFTKLPQISDIYKEIKFLKYNWKEMDQMLLPCKVYGGACKESASSFLPDVSR